MNIRIKLISLYILFLLLFLTIQSIIFFVTMQNFNTNTIITLLITALVFVAASSFVFSLIIKRVITVPLKTITEKMENLSNGNGDRKKVFKAKTKDEIAGLQYKFNEFSGRLEGLIKFIKERTDILKENDGKLADNIDKTSTEILESNTLNGIITGKMFFQNRSIQDFAGNSEEIVALWDDFQKLIEQQAVAVEESSSAITEMVTSIQNTSKTTDMVNSYAENLLSISEKGGNVIEESIRSIGEVSHISDELNEMMEIITEIATKTDLLSINASIEAAHAGDFGKGFAVVAEEIRMLADRTGENAKHITEILKLSDEKIKNASSISNNAGDMFKEIFTGVTTVVNYIKEIRLATEDQTVGGNELTESLTNLNNLTGNITVFSCTMKEQVDRLIDKLSELKGVAKETIDNSEIMGKSMDLVQKEIKNVQELTDKNSALIEMLKKNIKNFKLI